jgi:HPt (histidine-containing phosphotransfer) domain-containing protein
MTVHHESPGIYSAFGDDPELSGLVEMFVDEMPDRIQLINEALSSGDMESLQRTAHQMKGACGSYGFDQLTPYARAVEFSVRECHSATAIEAAVRELVVICDQVRAGQPS